IRDQDSGTFVILTSKKADYNIGLFYKEVELVTNKIVSAFGVDLQNLSNFTAEDKEQIAKSTWQGRVWGVYQTLIALEINQGTNKLSISIGPFRFSEQPETL
ncbi:MAG: hypothetical protein JNL69_11710, partial [Bacteroidia bacterium]|nr:hypothetical protein [Bacteroidia bacterium]